MTSFSTPSFDLGEAGKERQEQGLGALAKRCVRIADEPHRGGGVEGSVEIASLEIGDDHAVSSRDGQGADVIGVTGEPLRSEERARVDDEPVVPRDELVELSAGRDVLIFEAAGPALVAGPQKRRVDLLGELGQRRVVSRKEAAHGGEAVLELIAPSGTERERLRLASQAIEAAGSGAPARPPELIGQVLFQERDLGLNRHPGVRQPRLVAMIGSERHQHPGRSLLMHEPAGAVDGIDQQPIARPRRPGEDDALGSEALGDQHDTGQRPQLARDHLGQVLLAEGVDHVLRVTLGFAGHRREIVARLRALSQHVITKGSAETPQRRRELREAVRFGHRRVVYHESPTAWTLRELGPGEGLRAWRGMRHALVGIALFTAGCEVADDDPRSLGRFEVEASRTESCGDQVVLASPTSQTFWVFLRKTSEQMLLWDDGRERLPLALESDGHFGGGAKVVVAMDGPEPQGEEPDPLFPEEPIDPEAAPPGCVMVRLDAIEGELEADRFTGTLTHTFGAQDGSDCSALLAAPVPLADALPCSVSYDLDAERVP